MTPHDQDKLERLITTSVRGLPPRRAPASLESRVLAEISRRATLPWYRRNFANWPLPVQAAFVAVSLALIAAFSLGFRWVPAGATLTQLKASFGAELQWLQILRSLAETAGDAVQTILGSISPLWLYGGAAVIAGLYVLLFGLGAAAYRTLYVSR